MQSCFNNVSFFVKVEGQPYSNHRNPQGVYQVDVVEEKTLVHSACAAIQVVKDSVPFLDENPECFTLKAFSSDGKEVIIPRLLVTDHNEFGILRGRSFDHPEIITLQ